MDERLLAEAMRNVTDGTPRNIAAAYNALAAPEPEGVREAASDDTALVWRQCVCGAWYWGAAQTDADKAHSRILAARSEPGTEGLEGYWEKAYWDIVPKLQAALAATPAADSRGLDDGEMWRDEGIIAAVRDGKPLGPDQRARILGWYAALTDPDPAP